MAAIVVPVLDRHGQFFGHRDLPLDLVQAQAGPSVEPQPCLWTDDPGDWSDGWTGITFRPADWDRHLQRRGIRGKTALVRQELWP